MVDFGKKAEGPKYEAGARRQGGRPKAVGIQRAIL